MTDRRRIGASGVVVVLLLILGLVALAPPRASAHAALTVADPAPGATLGAAPTAVVLEFSEPVEPSLSDVVIRGADGSELAVGEAQPASGDTISLSLNLPPLERGIYTVEYRVISAVDGHATEGTYSFGVRESPSGGSVTATTTDTPSGSALEFFARWALLGGLVLLIGGAVAGAARFGGARGTDLKLAAIGWGGSVLGLILLAEAQRRLADVSLGGLLDTPVGGSLIWRGIAIFVAGCALLVARRAPRHRRAALAGAAGAALAAIAVHVEAGHAAAGDWSAALTVTVQVAHFAAAGIWFGGLAALLLGFRGASANERAAAIRSFARVAAVALVIVLVTGTVRAVDELPAVSELWESAYGLAVLAKIALIALIAALAFRSRRRSKDLEEGGLDPLRRSSRGELALAVAALGVAALLGTLAPPLAEGDGSGGAASGLSASGSDFATTVRAELTTASDQPGANRFELKVTDYDSEEPVVADRVSLEFTPVDDPGIEPTNLVLEPGGDGTYVGSGPNLQFDGRWEVVALIETGDGAVEVPLELEIPIPEQFISVLAVPGRAPEYTLQTNGGYIRIEAHPERAGPSKIFVTIYTQFEAEAKIEELVLVATAGDEPAAQQAVQRVGPGRFMAELDLVTGPYLFTVVARTRDGIRLRGQFELDIPEA